MKVWIGKSQSGCYDPDCCGGPSFALELFSSQEKALAAGYKEHNIEEAELDTGEPIYVG